MDTPLDSPAEGQLAAPPESADSVRPRLRPLPALRLAALSSDSDAGLVCAIDDPDCVSPADTAPEEASR